MIFFINDFLYLLLSKSYDDLMTGIHVMNFDHSGGNILLRNNVNKVNTTRKSINTNKNIKGIFSLINCRRILPKEIFSRYLPGELQ